MDQVKNRSCKPGTARKSSGMPESKIYVLDNTLMEHFSVCENFVSKTGSGYSPKLEVLQDSALETNSKFSNGVPADRFDFPNPLFCAFFLYPPPIMLYPLKSDAVRIVVTLENGRNRFSSINRLKI